MSTYLEHDARAIRSALPSDATPPPESDHLFILYAVLLRTKGTAVTLSDVHDAWAAWMTLTTPNHASIVPFDKLDLEIQKEDEPYVTAIRTVAEIRGAS